jgi:hypothetical protein
MRMDIKIDSFMSFFINVISFFVQDLNSIPRIILSNQKTSFLFSSNHVLRKHRKPALDPPLDPTQNGYRYVDLLFLDRITNTGY